MPKVKSLERAIANVEGFEVTIRHADGSIRREWKSSAVMAPGTRVEKKATRPVRSDA